MMYLPFPTCPSTEGSSTEDRYYPRDHCLRPLICWNHSGQHRLSPYFPAISVTKADPECPRYRFLPTRLSAIPFASLQLRLILIKVRSRACTSMSRLSSVYHGLGSFRDPLHLLSGDFLAKGHTRFGDTTRLYCVSAFCRHLISLLIHPLPAFGPSVETYADKTSFRTIPSSYRQVRPACKTPPSILDITPYPETSSQTASSSPGFDLRLKASSFARSSSARLIKTLHPSRGPYLYADPSAIREISSIFQYPVLNQIRTPG